MYLPWIGFLGALDELFKAHLVFGIAYCEILYNMYTFIQMTVYNNDMEKVKKNPREIEIRSRLLQENQSSV